MIIPLGTLHGVPHRYALGFKIQVVHRPHEFHELQGLGISPQADPLQPS